MILGLQALMLPQLATARASIVIGIVTVDE